MEAFNHLHDVATSNTVLAAALAAVGIPPAAQKPFVRVTEGGGRYRTIWFFEQASPDGKFMTKDLIRAWTDDDWHSNNPEHPFAYIKCAMLNRERLVDKVKQDVPLAAVRKGKKIAYIPIDATLKTEEKFLRNL